MEVVCFAAGFLIGMSLWMPSLVAVKIESGLLRLVTPSEGVLTDEPWRRYG